MNTSLSDRLPVALIAGPTASGKSALALAVAERGPVTIINADSAQVYADLRVLTARPDAADTARAPHRLLGYIDGDEACTAARWAVDAAAEIAHAHLVGRLPVLVGGTGLYLRTLLDGIAPVPPTDPDIRRTVRSLAVAEAYAALTQEDPDAAQRLAPADSTRVARALEVVRSTGRTLSDWQSEPTGGIGPDIHLTAVVLLPPREELIARCDRRFAEMVDTGAVDEVERLLARRLDPALPVMRAIGVREIAAWLDGCCSRSEMIEAGRTATRQYAKRQYTWFGNQSPPSWHRTDKTLKNIDRDVLAIKLYDDTLTYPNVADSCHRPRRQRQIEE